MKPLAINATIEQLIEDLSYWEDPDQILQVSHDGQGTYTIANPEWHTVGNGKTLKEALIDYGRQKQNESSKYNYGI